MTAPSTWRALVLAFVVAACSSTVATTPSTVVSEPTALPTASAPAATVRPTPTEYVEALPTTSKFGWWESSIKYCQPPAYYRLDGVVTALGSCPGAFLSPTPTSITLDVGQDIDLHMAVLADGRSPIYPLPVSEDETVALGWLIYDQATMKYTALLPGSTRLVSPIPCQSGFGPTPPASLAPTCPVLEIHVRDIELSCGGFVASVCRGAAAAAVPRWEEETSQRVVALRVEPSSLIGSFCGDLFAAVTITLADPAAEYDVSVGRYPSASADPPSYVVCTY